MQIRIISFGHLTEIIGAAPLTMDEVENTDEVIRRLHAAYPGLADMQYRIAVEKDIIAENIRLKDQDTIALLPPFSGG